MPTLKNPHQARRDLYVRTNKPYVRVLFYYVMDRDKSKDTRL
jgi:hypothetical protein